METLHSLESDLAYLRKLVRAGRDGIASARHEHEGSVFRPPLQTAALTPAAIGAAIGMLSTRLIGDRKSASRVAMGGLAGSVLGLGATVAWTSRSFTGPAARKTIRFVNAVRDAHWLETHPIDYA